MEFHEIDTKGKIWIQRVSSLPTWTADDVGRVVYDIGEDAFYFGSSSAWELWGSDIIPAGTKMIFYQNTAPTGWTIDAAIADALIAIKGGTASYNVNAGQVAGTWTQTNHTHTFSDTFTANHTHSVSHNHQWTKYTGGNPSEYTWESDGSTLMPLSNTNKNQNSIVLHVSKGDGHERRYSKYTKNYTGSTGSGGGSGTVSGTTSNNSSVADWRPYAAVCIVATKD